MKFSDLEPPRARNVRAAANRAELARKQLLLLRDRAPAIERALAAYNDMDNPDVTTIRIRTPFVRLEKARPLVDPSVEWKLKDELKTRPPMTRLIGRPSHALPTVLSFYFVARLRTEPRNAFVQDLPNMPKPDSWSWATLSGLNTGNYNPDNLGRSLNKTLKQLEKSGLVAFSQEKLHTGRYGGFKLMHEGGRNVPYVVPGDDIHGRHAIKLPADFFRQGWHLALTPIELATYLAVIDRTGWLSQVPRTGDVSDEGVDLKEEVRYGHYGLSTEAYNSVHRLAAYGLIKLKDPMVNRWGTRSTLADEGADGSRQTPIQRRPYRLIYEPQLDAPMPPAVESVANGLKSIASQAGETLTAG